VTDDEAEVPVEEAISAEPAAADPDA
jgi:hypothetical protein